MDLLEDLLVDARAGPAHRGVGDRLGLGHVQGAALGCLPTQEQTAIAIATQPTTLQHRAFGLLGIDPTQNVSMTVTG